MIVARLGVVLGIAAALEEVELKHPDGVDSW
jgi:hypothetical protein